MVFYAFLIVVLITIIFLFSSPKLSPIPYFPSNSRDMKIIIKSLGLNNNQTVIDLGAGDGIVIFDAAREALRNGLNTNFVAVEINPILILVLYLRRLLHPNKKRIKIIKDDIFKMKYSPLIKDKNSAVFYIYISPWHIEKTLDNIKNQLKKFSIISYMYPVKSLSKKEKKTDGYHAVFVYNE